MIFGFILWVFLAGIIIASLQDLKRREVDNWLNLSMIVLSSAYILFSTFTLDDWISPIIFVFVVGITTFLYFGPVDEKKTSMIMRYTGISLRVVASLFLVLVLIKYFGLDSMPLAIVASCSFLIMFVVSILFYEGRVFAGGDANLLFALSILFVGFGFLETIRNIGTFLLFLMFSGSVYGLAYSFILYFKKRKEANKEIKKNFSLPWIKYSFVLGAIFLGLSYFSWLFLLLTIYFLGFPLLFAFAKGLEKVSMVRFVSGRELTEGDWLEEDVSVGKKKIRAHWDGLSKQDIALMKGLKKVKIKEGIPFVPAFLIAFFLYVFLRNYFLSLFGLA